MSNLTIQQKAKLALADFGDPKTREFAIVDQEDVNAAARVIATAKGKSSVKARIVSIAKRKGLTVPDAWKNTFSVAAFSLEQASESSDAVELTGKVFELGDFPDKGFSLDEAEADEAIRAFEGVDNDLEHRDTILSGHLGQLAKLQRVGKDIVGTVRVPKWLHELQGDRPIGVSLAWDEAKRVVGNALTLNPRITDAKVAAAFTADSGFEANEAFQFFTEFVGRRNSTNDQSDLQMIHDLTAKLGAECKARDEKAAKDNVVAKYTKPNQGAPTRMKVRELLALFGIGDIVDREAEIPPFTPPANTPSTPPATGQPTGTSFSSSPEAKAMQAEIEKGRKANLQAQAQAFVKDLRAARKIVPAQEDAVIAAFCQAAVDDAVGQTGHIAGLALFNDDGKVVEGSRLATLRKQYEGAPSNNFTQELLGESDAHVLYSSGTQDKLNPDETMSLLSKTPLGQAVIANARGNK